MANRTPAGCQEQDSATLNQAPRRFRLILADDHQEVRDEIRHFLELEFDVLQVVSEGTALLKAAAELKPDVVISDIQMPRMNGIDAGRKILGDGLCLAFVALSMFPDAYLVKTALQAGIRGYVLKVDASEELIPAIYAAIRGDRYLSQGIRDSYRD